MKTKVNQYGIIEFIMTKAEHEELEKRFEIPSFTRDVECPLTTACKWLYNWSKNTKNFDNGKK